jgi:DNA replication and repair protein RecF
MSIQQVEMISFRSHKKKVITFSPGINLIWGENGSGKTSVLEAVYILSNGKSFKTNKLSETIQEGQKETVVTATFDDMKTTTLYQPSLGHKKIKINNTPSNTKDLIGKNPTVLVSPEEEKITKGPHADRRVYFNRLFSNVSKTYLFNLIKYTAAIKNRNHLLKQNKQTSEVVLWDAPVAKYGTLLWLEKKELQKTFNKETSIVCKKYSNNVEVDVLTSAPKNPTEKDFLLNLEKNISREAVVRRTLVGPHTDKYTITFKNKPLREYGSQGEHKLSFVLLKVAEHRFIENETNKKPTLLLDDLFAKLDLDRGNAIFDLIKNSGQTIITNTDLAGAENHGINTDNPNNKAIHLVRKWKN